MKKLLFTVIIAASIVGCSPSTQIVKSWQEPNVSLSRSASNKVLVVAMVKDESSRRVIEDQLVKRIGTNATASYNFINTDMLKEANGDKFMDKLKQDNYNYVLMMRLADVEKETSYVPGTTTGFYGGYGRFYGYGAGMYSNPGYYTTDKNYFFETTVYSVNPDKLLWTGTTKTVNPSKIEKTVNDIADAVSEKMTKDGFLK
ncbi:MAG TPA: hypothetical protein PKM63_20060 [Panacibacter sp.]|nr:hypothetical protein [Panacibacter sp.]HNP46602.1 hypothetical protein [Panacibacter sp.]